MIEMVYRDIDNCVTINPKFIKKYNVTGTHAEGFTVTFVMADNSIETHKSTIYSYQSISDIKNSINTAINRNEDFVLYCQPKG